MASVESEKLAEKREATVEPAGEAVSSLTDGRVAEPVARGASLIELTVSATVSVAVEKGLLPPVPLVVIEAVPPALPLD